MSSSNRSEQSAHLGYWGFSSALILSCLIVWGVAYSQGREAERRERSPQYHAESARAYAKRTCAEPNLAATIECVDTALAASREASRAEQDLDAQQRMAFWALLTVVVSIVTVGVTAIGVWFVKRTLDATLEAVADTSKATNAMIDANRIAEDTAQRQLRAYLYAGSGQLTLSRNVRTVSFPIRVPFRNTGSTPATLLYYKMESSIRSERARTKNLSTHRQQKVKMVETNLQKIIGPNQETYISIGGLVENDHFFNLSAMSAGYDFKGIEFEIEIEWHYSDYLNRVWRVDAVFTSDNFIFNTQRVSKDMRQKSAKERQIS